MSWRRKLSHARSNLHPPSRPWVDSNSQHNRHQIAWPPGTPLSKPLICRADSGPLERGIDMDEDEGGGAQTEGALHHLAGVDRGVVGEIGRTSCRADVGQYV